MPRPIRTKRLHWINALLTIIRLRKTGRLVENDVLAALKITLHPPSSPAAAPPDLLDRIRSSMLEEDEPEFRKERHADTRERAQSPVSTGLWNCRLSLSVYESISDRGNFGGYYVAEWVLCIFGKMNALADIDLKYPLLFSIMILSILAAVKITYRNCTE